MLCRRPHARTIAMPVFQEQDQQRGQHQHGLRDGAKGQLPPVRRRQQPSAAGHGDAQRLRQRLLQQPDFPEGAPTLGPGAVQRRRCRQHSPELCIQRRDVQQRLHHGHGEDGEHRAQDGDAGADQARLLQGQLVISAPPTLF
uniref:Uncharacterized protein n=1 Tax=Aegilops tauschii subsp. strangulata TaxID=200361 RepID=A0A453API3_AEGTS